MHVFMCAKTSIEMRNFGVRCFMLVACLGFVYIWIVSFLTFCYVNSMLQQNCLHLLDTFCK